MPRFDYVRAHSVAEAVQLLGDPGVVSRPLAGGTDVLVFVRHEKPPFDRLVDISRVPEMKIIERHGDEIVVGAAVTFTEAAESPVLQEVAACLVEACLSVGGPAIRNAGTLGGNVANAAACADSLPSLVCLDAVAHLCSLTGERCVARQRSGDRRQPHRAPARRVDHALHLPRAAGGCSFGVHQAGPPQCAGHLSPEHGRRGPARCPRLRGFRAAVARRRHASQPRRFTEVEAMLLGQEPTDELLAAAGVRPPR